MKRTVEAPRPEVNPTGNMRERVKRAFSSRSTESTLSTDTQPTSPIRRPQRKPRLLSDAILVTAAAGVLWGAYDKGADTAASTASGENNQTGISKKAGTESAPRIVLASASSSEGSSVAHSPSKGWNHVDQIGPIYDDKPQRNGSHHKISPDYLKEKYGHGDTHKPLNKEQRKEVKKRIEKALNNDPLLRKYAGFPDHQQRNDHDGRKYSHDRAHHKNERKNDSWKNHQNRTDRYSHGYSDPYREGHYERQRANQERLDEARRDTERARHDAAKARAKAEREADARRDAEDDVRDARQEGYKAGFRNGLYGYDSPTPRKEQPVQTRVVERVREVKTPVIPPQVTAEINNLKKTVADHQKAADELKATNNALTQTNKEQAQRIDAQNRDIDALKGSVATLTAENEDKSDVVVAALLAGLVGAAGAGALVGRRRGGSNGYRPAPAGGPTSPNQPGGPESGRNRPGGGNEGRTLWFGGRGRRGGRRTSPGTGPSQAPFVANASTQEQARLQQQEQARKELRWNGIVETLLHSDPIKREVFREHMIHNPHVGTESIQVDLTHEDIAAILRRLEALNVNILRNQNEDIEGLISRLRALPIRPGDRRTYTVAHLYDPATTGSPEWIFFHAQPHDEANPTRN